MKLVQAIITLILSLAVCAITAKACTVRWQGKYWKLCIIGCVLSLFATATSILLHGLGMRNIQTLFLCCTFLYASYGDIKTHEADDFIHVLVLAIALMNKPAAEIPAALLASVVLSALMMFVALCVPGAGIGGADIKFVAACAFFSSLQLGLIGLGLGAFLGLIFNSPFRKNAAEGEGFPMLPYLSCSYMLVYLLS